MTNTNRAPTPWTITIHANATATIYDANGDTVAKSYTGDDALFIIRVVNAHDTLTRDLTERAGNIETTAAYLRIWKDADVTKPNVADTPTIKTLIEALEICGKESRATLALAKGDA